MPRLLTLLASQNAQVLDTAKISRAIELHAVTTDQYIKSLEFQTGAIVGVEVKAGKRLTDSDFRGLRKLKDYVGSDFHCGILLYQGEFSHRNADGLIAFPADRMWID